MTPVNTPVGRPAATSSSSNSNSSRPASTPAQQHQGVTVPALEHDEDEEGKGEEGADSINYDPNNSTSTSNINNDDTHSGTSQTHSANNETIVLQAQHDLSNAPPFASPEAAMQWYMPRIGKPINQNGNIVLVPFQAAIDGTNQSKNPKNAFHSCRRRKADRLQVARLVGRNDFEDASLREITPKCLDHVPACNSHLRPDHSAQPQQQPQQQQHQQQHQQQQHQQPLQQQQQQQQQSQLQPQQQRDPQPQRQRQSPDAGPPTDPGMAEVQTRLLDDERAGKEASGRLAAPGRELHGANSDLETAAKGESADAEAQWVDVKAEWVDTKTEVAEARTALERQLEEHIAEVASLKKELELSVTARRDGEDQAKAAVAEKEKYAQALFQAKTALREAIAEHQKIREPFEKEFLRIQAEAAACLGVQYQGAK